MNGDLALLANATVRALIARGESLNGFIQRAIEEAIERDNEKRTDDTVSLSYTAQPRKEGK